MADMFSSKAIHRHPNDIELVRQVTLQQVSDWLMPQCEGLPEHLLDRIRDLDTLKEGLSPIFDEMRDGDSIWLSQSKVRGPLWGSEGIALVRDSQPVIYIRVVNH